LNCSEIEVRHGLSATVPEILDAAVADDEEDGDTRPLHTGLPNRVGEPQRCSTKHLQQRESERDFQSKEKNPPLQPGREELDIGEEDEP
jgi:hypothetical protein